MNRYESYKDSGVEWIGSIPSGWNSVKIKSCFRERKDYGSDTEYQPLSVSKKGVVPQLENVSKTDNHNNRKIVQKGDFVINSRSDRKGSSGVSNLNGSVSVINIVLTPNSKFFNELPNYLFKTYEFKEEFFRNGKGIHWDLWSTRFSEMKEMIIPLPPPSEQQEIISYLDKKTSSIDSLIQSKEKKIELLKEKRTSLINQVVTKGLNPDVEMKDSGVEWIGEIKSGWGCIELKFVLEILTDFESNGSFSSVKENVKVLEGDGPVWYVRMTDLENNNIRNENCRYCDYETYNFLQKTKLDGGELLITKRGEIGKVYVFPKHSGKSTLGPNSYLLKLLQTKTIPYFLFYFYISSYGQITLKLMDKSTTIGSIYKDDLKNSKILLPPLHEQHQIVSYLDKETKLIDETISSEQKKIELLKEYKQSLISEVVTGKRKVTTDD